MYFGNPTRRVGSQAFHVLDVQAFFESSNRLTSVNRLTSLPGPGPELRSGYP